MDAERKALEALYRSVGSFIRHSEGGKMDRIATENMVSRFYSVFRLKHPGEAPDRYDGSWEDLITDIVHDLLGDGRLQAEAEYLASLSSEERPHRLQDSVFLLLNELNSVKKRLQAVEGQLRGGLTAD